MNDAASSARDMAVRARTASRKLQALPSEERVAMLNRIADALVANEATILAENAKVRRLSSNCTQASASHPM